MNNKGFAASGVLYTILVIGLVSMISLLYDLQNKKTILDKLKLEVVEATDESCSDPGFSLKVAAYTVATALPSTSFENNIAIITSVAINKTYLSDIAPTEPVQGDVWVLISSFRNKYMTKDNIQVPVSYVQQYVSGNWVYKEAYIFKNTSWESLNDLSGAFTTVNFGYTGDVQTFVAPATGYYKIETWGAAGGLAGAYAGGKGGYSVGMYHMDAGETLYVYVGGAGTSSCTTATCPGGYNGGGRSGYDSTGPIYASGGGATDIRTVPERKLYRYVRDYSTGNSGNLANHWVEIQVFNKNNTLISQGKTVTSNCAVSGNLSIVTNGVTDTATYVGTDAGECYVEIDLGQEYEIGKVTVWHYYGDSRIYYNTRTQIISSDRTKTSEINSYLKSGQYAEVAAGKTYYVDGTTDLTSLQSRIIVAAGGGGATQNGTAWYGAGGIAGGISGISGGYAGTYTNHPGGGGTQTAGGTSLNCGLVTGASTYIGNAIGGFGYGGGRHSNSSGGGGGYYGGGCGYGGGGGGGSGYVGGVTTYGGVTATTISGNASFPSTSGTTETGHAGNGYAKITLLSLG